MAERDGSQTRNQILSAAEALIRDRGLGAATTKAIAERAGCAEGSIYRYFSDKHALFVEVIRSRFPEFLELMDALPERAGSSTVRRNLEEVARTALSFYRGVLPMSAGSITDRRLVEEQRRHFRATKQGPLRALGALSTYIRREQRLGRVSDRASAEHLARALFGACFLQAFLAELLGEDASLGTDDRFAKEVVRSLMEGLTVRNAPTD